MDFNQTLTHERPHCEDLQEENISRLDPVCLDYGPLLLFFGYI